LAAARAINATGVLPDLVLLDGKHDWMSRVAPRAQVVTRIKADTTCAAVAGASIIAKVARDSLMVDLAATHPEYGWESNKGYAAPDHLAALERYGPTPGAPARAPPGDHAPREGRRPVEGDAWAHSICSVAAGERTSRSAISSGSDSL
jgi:ribonuclease HII